MQLGQLDPISGPAEDVLGRLDDRGHVEVSDNDLTLISRRLVES